MLAEASEEFATKGERGKTRFDGQRRISPPGKRIFLTATARLCFPVFAFRAHPGPRKRLSLPVKLCANMTLMLPAADHRR